MRKTPFKRLFWCWPETRHRSRPPRHAGQLALSRGPQPVAEGEVRRRQKTQTGANDGADRTVEIRAARVWAELGPVLDQELSRLADKYRAAGRALRPGREDAKRSGPATRGAGRDTVDVALAKARGMLAKRMAHQGFTLSASDSAVLLAQHSASAAVPAAQLMSTAIQAGGAVASAEAGSGGAGAVSAKRRPVARKARRKRQWRSSSVWPCRRLPRSSCLPQSR